MESKSSDSDARVRELTGELAHAQHGQLFTLLGVFLEKTTTSNNYSAAGSTLHVHACVPFCEKGSRECETGYFIGSNLISDCH